MQDIHPTVPNPYNLLSALPPERNWYTVLDLKDAFFCLRLHPTANPSPSPTPLPPKTLLTSPASHHHPPPAPRPDASTSPPAGLLGFTAAPCPSLVIWCRTDLRGSQNQCSHIPQSSACFLLFSGSDNTHCVVPMCSPLATAWWLFFFFLCFFFRAAPIGC